ncbi:MAG: sulfatase-like hydrolase/transferase [Verrucomicrobiota bacterium]
MIDAVAIYDKAQRRMKPFTLIAFVLLLIVVPLPSAEGKPNILLILADDMGYGDLGFTGSQHLKTPHLDELAQTGVFCRQAYVPSSVCSPSRAGIMTGRDPRRFGYEGNLNKGDASYPTRPELLGLPPGEHTLGDQLRVAGYATGLVGKWHLGIGDGFHPNERGFDFFCGMLTGSHSYFPNEGKHKIERNGTPLTEFSSDYLTDFFTDEALRWMEEQSNKEVPWFLFASYNAPHGPMHATEDDLAHFTHITDSKRRTYAAMMFALDRGIGRIRNWLRENGELENTLIVFFSDNGAATSNASWNGPLSGSKGTLKEGGIRIPMIWSWPEALTPGEVATPVSALDLLPTFLSAAESDPLPLSKPLSHEDKNNRKRAVDQYGAYDGINLLPILRGNESSSAPRTLFWRLQGQAAVLDGEEKLIRPSHRPAQLFQPGSDLGEMNDLAATEKPRLEELFRQLAEWESTLPTIPLWGSSPNWNRVSASQYDELVPREEPQ